ncbi:hypothetical protein [Achromobacter marplatensis]|uniref:Uncharacterized protein n=1 Tax=Achromobacter marplatensis TaxID=470868 RepID=A0AA42WFM6_9BURK|nr:hypothetical protein [Achromobacter marplatensis]MDH2053381.1 hypothetical protein [Achromobacter marplatensis]
MPQIITATLAAYLYAKSSMDPAALFAADKLSQPEKETLLSRLTLSGAEWIREDGDYIPVGTVEVAFTPSSTDKMIQGQVAALQAQKKKILAEATREANRIQEMISKLQALTLEA